MSDARTPPGQRPPGRAAGTQRWRQLAFVHWEVDPASLAGALPDGLEVDVHDGRTYVGLVPFAMRRIKSSWMPAALALDFLETNLRCYVRYRGEPGVYFFSLEASSWLAVKVARLQWGLPYHHARMTLTREGDVITATSSRRAGGAGLELRYRVGESLGTSEPGSLDHFLLERYLLFAERRGRLLRGQVHHEPYPVSAAELLDCRQDLTAAAGLSIENAPSLICASEGVDVEVFAPS